MSIINRQSRRVLINQITLWQKNPYIHQLTCATDSSHRDLVPAVTSGKVILLCTDCGYTQDAESLFMNQSSN